MTNITNTELVASFNSLVAAQGVDFSSMSESEVRHEVGFILEGAHPGVVWDDYKEDWCYVDGTVRPQILEVTDLILSGMGLSPVARPEAPAPAAAPESAMERAFREMGL